MLAVLMIPLTVFVGGSLDWSQQITTKAKMQSTVDSAILAVARQLTTKKKLTQAEMDSIAKTVFDTNISVAANVKMANFKITLKDDLLRITQQAEVSTSFLKIIDIPTLGVNVVSEVLVKFEGVDIALAVDLSGSMGGNKIQHLRNATVSLLEELTASNLTEMRVAFVPWTRGVNLKGYYYKVTKPAAQNARRPQARERNTSQAKNVPQAKNAPQARNVPQARNSGDRNHGDNNSGNDNHGYRNDGDRNRGNNNSGNDNVGNYNSGDRNRGNYNSGNGNIGNRNSGNGNVGDRNSGHRNKGNDNKGNGNVGNNNDGHRNKGNGNKGNANTGNKNDGHRNKGNHNSGNDNKGNYNHGNGNVGDYNMGNYHHGNGPGAGSGSGSGSGTPNEPENTCVGTRADGKLRADNTTIEHPLENKCPSAKLIPLTNLLEVKNNKTGQKRLEAIANSWTTDGGTGSHNGMYWAAATLNSAFYPIFGTKTPKDPKSIKKYIIIMTDGLNNSSNFNTQMLAACAQAKAQGISIYSIVLMEKASSVVNTFRACATADASGREYFIQTDNSALLKEDFRRIVAEIGQFYLSK
uniref:VWFA domain-containing protein n=1 Tax=OCS116 cluster bacterium TaxID=2030921 RepID=A0A2A4Z4E2_9PROT